VNLLPCAAVPIRIDPEEAWMRTRTLMIPVLTSIAALAALAMFAGVAAAAPKTTIKLGDNFYSPSAKRIAVGTKVRFKWTGRTKHNVTKRRGPGGRFASRTTREDGVNFVKRFNKPGTYRFVCTIHPEEMKLTLTVR
jgi:plastocyanin